MCKCLAQNKQILKTRVDVSKDEVESSSESAEKDRDFLGFAVHRWICKCKDCDPWHVESEDKSAARTEAAIA